MHGGSVSLLLIYLLLFLSLLLGFDVLFKSISLKQLINKGCEFRLLFFDVSDVLIDSRLQGS